MSYPEAYDPALKKWNLHTLPFIPDDFKYEVIPAVAKQFKTVSGILNREDVDTIYVCTDSGREGEYIYRLVEQEAHVTGQEAAARVDRLPDRGGDSAGNPGGEGPVRIRQPERIRLLKSQRRLPDGDQFLRLLTLKYGNSISSYLKTKYTVISVGRVMTCVLGMVVPQERRSGIREDAFLPGYKYGRCVRTYV